jgi:preprotein translocase subunit SecB
MAKKDNGAEKDVAGAEIDENAPQVGIIAQYTKDMSFENPNAPATFQELAGTKPQIDVNVNVAAKKLGEDSYEVQLKLTALANTDDKVAFAIELVYAGLFGIRNLPEEDMQGLLLIQAPTILFPFARRVIADATRDGGYPPLLLDPIDFGVLYQRSQERAQEQVETEKPAS